MNKTIVIGALMLLALPLNGCFDTKDDTTSSVDTTTANIDTQPTTLITDEQSATDTLDTVIPAQEDLEQMDLIERIELYPSKFTESEKKARGIPTNEEIKIITNAYSMYEFYGNVYGILENQFTNLTPELTEEELNTFSDVACSNIEVEDNELTLASLINISANTNLASFDKPNEHLGGALGVAIYYQCPEYVEPMNAFQSRFNNAQ